jgi:hypothetical protein
MRKRAGHRGTESEKRRGRAERNGERERSREEEGR